MKRIALVIVFSMLLTACDIYESKNSSYKINLPLKDTLWRKIPIEKNYLGDTYVLELENGWLVFHVWGASSGMAFVPRPAEKSL